MNIGFRTQSFLLRERFGRTRTSLNGEQRVDERAKLGEVVLYSTDSSWGVGGEDKSRSRFTAGRISKIKTPLNDFFVAQHRNFVAVDAMATDSSVAPILDGKTEWLDYRVKELARKKAGQITRISKLRTRGKGIKPKRRGNRIVGWFLSIITVLSVLFGLVLFVPAAYYLVFPADVIELKPNQLSSSPGGESTRLGGLLTNPSTAAPKPTPEPYIPPKDETLPDGDWLVIPRIGVRTPLRKTVNPDKALEKGVWQVPDFGVPGDRTQPMILAAHRFGWQWWWKDEYWKYNSFYNLPTTEPGDLVEVISDKRKWTYEIYAGEEGKEITDYHADLILYTCKYLQSPVRHFRYARIIDPTVMTQ